MRAILLLLVALSLAACGGSVTGPDAADFEARATDEESRPLVPGN